MVFGGKFRITRLATHTTAAHPPEGLVPLAGPTGQQVKVSGRLGVGGFRRAQQFYRCYRSISCRTNCYTTAVLDGVVVIVYITATCYYDAHLARQMSVRQGPLDLLAVFGRHSE